jgi:hypothetical protein
MHVGSIDADTKANLVYKVLREHKGHRIDAGRLAIEVARLNGGHFLNALGTRVSEVRTQLKEHPERGEFVPDAERVGHKFFYALMPVQRTSVSEQLPLGV